MNLFIILVDLHFLSLVIDYFCRQTFLRGTIIKSLFILRP